jgi:pyruvate dehydrogenase kinase 2/3/4
MGFDSDVCFALPSFRRYLEQQLNGEDVDLEPIRVVIVQGAEDVTIKIADRGGGIPRSKMATIWKFSHSTANADESSSEFGFDGLTGTKIKGFGLPLARIYARYLGGELTLKSMEGYGLDAYLYLPRLGENCENLPRRVIASPGELDSNPQNVTPPSRFR